MVAGPTFHVQFAPVKDLCLRPGGRGSQGAIGRRPTAWQRWSLWLVSAQAGPSSSRRYNLTISLAIRNLLNRNNPGPIVGNIESPLFGRANQPYGVGTLGGTSFSESADNRRLEL
ncbi:MAG TPA: hypothetical protein VG206_16970 [Terriglobia bacterium]|nr:hypothetical protein [Terriglobia bacterium]